MTEHLLSTSVVSHSVLVEGLSDCGHYEAVGASAGCHQGNVVAAEPDGTKRIEQLAGGGGHGIWRSDVYTHVGSIRDHAH